MNFSHSTLHLRLRIEVMGCAVQDVDRHDTCERASGKSSKDRREDPGVVVIYSVVVDHRFASAVTSDADEWTGAFERAAFIA